MVVKLPMRIGNVQTRQQPLQLALVNGNNFINRLRPFEPILFQTLLPEAKTIAIPIQDLDDAAESIAENEQVAGERVQVQGLLHQDGQAVDGFTHIRAA